MRCSHFLELYSDYRDGLVANPEMRRRLTRHANRCARCRRYHETVNHGLEVLQRNRREIEPSQRFRVALLARVEHAQHTRRRATARTGRLVGTAVVASAIVVSFTDPQGQRQEPPLRVAAVPAPTPAAPPVVTVTTGYPFADFTDITPAVLRPQPVPAQAIPLRQEPSPPIEDHYYAVPVTLRR